ncbi:aldehyde dehydrogenase family protein, partial [Paraburkholderia sp. Cy-641]
MKNVAMLIGGEQVQARNGAIFERRNPLDGEVATRAPAATVEDAVAAVDAAAAAFPVWSALGPGER